MFASEKSFVAGQKLGHALPPKGGICRGGDLIPFASTVTESERKKVIAINRKIRQYRKALDEMILTGARSATISTGGNSQSYTRFDLADIETEITRLEAQKAVILRGGRGYRRVAPDFSF